MSHSEIPDEVRNFISNHIDSVAKLEVLFLLARSPETHWTSKSVSRELRSNDTAVERNLRELVVSGLLEINQLPELNDVNELFFAYRPKNAELEKVVSDLVELYATYQMRIIHLIYNRPLHKIQSFANAFRIRKDEDDAS